MGKAVSRWVGLFLGLPSSSQHKSDEGAGLWYNQQTAIQRSKLVGDQRIAAAGPPDPILGLL